MSSNAEDLLLEIVKCPNIRHCIKDPGQKHPCDQIVHSQNSKVLEEHQVPEPWSGEITRAPLLFLSSNPSISETELFPRWSWPEDKIRDYFNERFGKWIQDGLYNLQQNGSYSKSVPFWREVRSRASELFGRAVYPGSDYALTCVVHCKSRNSKGVASAADECSKLYLDRVLSFAAAKVVVTLGDVAARAMAERYGLDPASHFHGPLNIGGQNRLVIFLGNPGSNKRRKFATCATAEELEMLVAAVSS